MGLLLDHFHIVAIMEQKMRFVVLGLTYIQHATHQLLLNHNFLKDMAKIKCTLFRVLGKKVKQLKQQEEF
jgi:hypothetical protein